MPSNIVQAGNAVLFPQNDFNEEEYNFDRLEYEKCKNPNCISNKFKIKTKSNHQLVQKCAKCGEWQKNIPKENRNFSRNSSSSYSLNDVANRYNLDEPSCVFCRRKKHQLPDRHGLEIDHIKEINNENGDDELDNLQILCTKCHKLKNHERKYNNWDEYGKPCRGGE